MQIKLNFTEPLYISHGGTDKSKIVVVNNTFFKRAAFEDYLPMNYTMTKGIHN